MIHLFVEFVAEKAAFSPMEGAEAKPLSNY